MSAWHKMHFAGADLPEELRQELVRLAEGGSLDTFRAPGSREWENELWNGGRHAENELLKHFHNLASGRYETMRGGDQTRQMAEQALRRQGLGHLLDQYSAYQDEQARPQLQFFDPTDYLMQEDELAPYLNEDMLLDPNSLEMVSADPGSIQAQQSALQQLAQWSKGDVTAADRAMYDASNMQNRMQADQMARSQREALAQQYASRGLGGSMTDLAQQMQANQGQAQRYGLTDAQNRANMMGQIQQRALDALSQQGTLAGEMRGDAFQENSFNADATNYALERNADRRGDWWQQQQADINNLRLHNSNQGLEAARGNTDLYNTSTYQTAGMHGDSAAQEAGQLNNLANTNQGLAQQRRADQDATTANAVQAGTEGGRLFGMGLSNRSSEEPKKKKTSYTGAGW